MCLQVRVQKSIYTKIVSATVQFLSQNMSDDNILHIVRKSYDLKVIFVNYKIVFDTTLKLIYKKNVKIVWRINKYFCNQYNLWH